MADDNDVIDSTPDRASLIVDAMIFEESQTTTTSTPKLVVPTVTNEMAVVECFQQTITADYCLDGGGGGGGWYPPAHPSIANWKPLVLNHSKTIRQKRGSDDAAADDADKKETTTQHNSEQSESCS